jgi:hypothetical protein
MQPLKGRRVLFGALAVLACSGDPTGNESTPTAITASPSVVFVTQGQTQPVIASVIDEDGQILQSDINATNVGTGITVVEDSTFQTVNTGTPIARQHRFLVTANELAATSFTLEGLGIDTVLQVTSVPGTLAATISNLTPALGDTISITAPTGTLFTESSELTFEGAAPQVVSQDASTIVFIPFPNITAPAVVSDVGVTSNPNLTFTLATVDTVRTDSILDIGSNLTPSAPALGGTVTLVLPPELRVLPESLVASGVGADTIPPVGLQIAGAAVAPRDVAVSADSGTITFVPPPNADSVVVVPGIIARRLPQYPLQLSTAVKVTTPVVDSFPSTVSDPAPDANEAVTLTSTDANFSLAADAGVLVGGTVAAITARAGDGSSLAFVPAPGVTGSVTVTGVEVVGFPLELPSTAPAITVSSTVTAIAGTDDPATAPALPVPAAAGLSTSTFDDAVFTAADITGDGGVGAQYYTITLGAAATLTISISSADGVPDLDGVICNDVACSVPDFSVASTAHDESAAVALAAGTHILAIVNFDGGPTDWFNVTITR